MPPKTKSTKDTKSKDTKSKDSKTKDKSKDSKSREATTTSKPKGAQSLNIRHILCAKHSTKESALARLREGAKFDDVARDLSEDKARQGGSLGWQSKGSLLPEFEAVAYELPVSSTGQPVWGECKTAEGYHVVMVEGRK